MALSGLEIYKLLPKTNCKKCGFQTCLAFAMQLAKKAVSLEKCPFVSGQVRSMLEEASMPAIRLVQIGSLDRNVQIGNETVLFRHEEKFYHPTAVGFILSDDLSDADLESACGQINSLVFERVGETIRPDLVALEYRSADKKRYLSCLKKVLETVSLGAVLMVSDHDVLKSALEDFSGFRPLVYCGDRQEVDGCAQLCAQFNVPFAFRGSGTEEFDLRSKQLTAWGVTDLVFEVPQGSVSERIWQLTQLRRLAIKKGQRSLGFPAMAIIDSGDPHRDVCAASSFLCKYAGAILLKERRPEFVLPLLTLRQNIFTDPQKPLQVEPKVYTVGQATKNSPVLVTTNFSLTYYTVLGEIESSRIGAHLICLDTEGMSVLTAWAAEKFNAEKISEALIKSQISEKVAHRNLIIPGYVAMLSGELEDRSGWNVLVGPREASGLPSFLRSLALS